MFSLQKEYLNPSLSTQNLLKMNSALSKNLIFSLEKFDDWKICIHAHLSALHDEMWEVRTKGHVRIMKVNTTYILDPNSPQYIPKLKMEMKIHLIEMVDLLLLNHSLYG